MFDINNVEFIRANIIFSELTIILGRCFWAQYIILDFFKMVADRLLRALYPAALGFLLMGALRGGAGKSAVYKCTRSLLAWMRARLFVCVFVCLCEQECQGERAMRRWMNGIIYIFKNRKKYINKRNQFVALGVESVALRPTLVYVWETLIWGSHHGFPRFDQPKYKTFFLLF